MSCKLGTEKRVPQRAQQRNSLAWPPLLGHMTIYGLAAIKICQS